MQSLRSFTYETCRHLRTARARLSMAANALGVCWGLAHTKPGDYDHHKPRGAEAVLRYIDSLSTFPREAPPLTYSEHLTSQTLQVTFFFEPKDFT